MKTITGISLAIGLATTPPAHAGEAKGVILHVNANAMTVTIDNGETYALPPDFDVSLITKGMLVALAHDDDPAKTVTDMEQID